MNVSPPLAVRIEPPLCSFGIIADIQYSDCPDGMNYSQTSHRYYRDARRKLDDAITFWNTNNSLDFVLQLGDLIDGVNNKIKYGSTTALQTIRESFRKLNADLHNVIGNHEFYNFTREELIKSGGFFRTNLSGKSMYYDFTVASWFRFVVLDCYDISVLGHDQTSENYKKAFDILKRKNPNDDWNSSNGLEGLSQRFVGYNGAVSEEQLAWLEHVLSDADQKEQIVIVAGEHN